MTPPPPSAVERLKEEIRLLETCEKGWHTCRCVGFEDCWDGYSTLHEVSRMVRILREALSALEKEGEVERFAFVNPNGVSDEWLSAEIRHLHRDGFSIMIERARPKPKGEEPRCEVAGNICLTHDRNVGICVAELETRVARLERGADDD